MKTLLLLLHIFLSQWVVTLGDKDCNIGGKNISDADGEILLPLTGNELPLTILGRTVNYTDVKIVNFTPSNETNLKICPSIGDNAHLTIDAPLLRERITHSVLLIVGERIVFKVDYRIRLGLSEPGHGHQGKSKYEKKPLHAANITNC